MDGSAQREGRAAGDRLLAGDRLRRRGEAEIIDSLCALATTYRLDEDELNEALVERRIRLGAAGTPTVSEYLSLEVAGLLGCTATAAASRLADALNLRYRHPRLYQAVQEMDIDAGRALKAAARCTGLHPIQTDAVTTAWLAQQKGLGWTAAFNALDKLITESDIELAAEKERRARQDRGVYAWGAQDGVMNLTGRLDVTDARLVDDRLSLFADLIEPEYPALNHSQRRAKAMGVLTDPRYALALLDAAGQPELPGTTACHCGCHHTDADTPTCITRPAHDAVHGPADAVQGGADAAQSDPIDHLEPPATAAAGPPTPASTSPAGPGQEPTAIVLDQPADPPGTGTTMPRGRHRPTLHLAVHIHSDATGETTGVARVERAGHITTALLAELIADIPGLRVRVQPVIDLPAMAPADAYVPTRVMRRATIMAFPHEPFPFSILSSEGLDLDHTTAYRPGRPGQTGVGKLAPLSRRVHRAKTAGWWILDQPIPGRLNWTSPLGYRYDVTPFGTRRLDADGSEETHPVRAETGLHAVESHEGAPLEPVQPRVS